MHADGYWQLQTVRYESIKLAEQMENVQAQIVDISDQMPSPESEESNKKSVKKRRVQKKEKENTACPSDPKEGVHNAYQFIGGSEQHCGISISPQGRDQCEASRQSAVEEADTQYQYVTFVELPPHYLSSAKTPIQQVPHVPLHETLQPITVGSDGLDHSSNDHPTRSLYHDFICENENEASPLQGSQAVVVDNTTENYNLEMLGDVALRAPLEDKFSSPPRTRKRKQTMTNKYDENVTVKNSNCVRQKSSRQLKLQNYHDLNHESDSSVESDETDDNDI
jgi:hypothetical protein